MSHYSDEDLILYYYGEGNRRAAIERHLDACAACAESYRSIAGTLALVVEPELPARGDRYGLEVWQRIRHQLPESPAPWWTAWFHWDRLALAGGALALAVVIAAAFVAGRVWPTGARPQPGAVQAADTPADAGARVLMAAVSDHLERSERVLLDIMNASGASGARDSRVDMRDEQAWASDLIDANRLYRQAATRDGDTTVAMVLDDLERNLLEIVHGPSTLTAAQLEQVRARIDAAALLFKVRVLHDELREREAAPAPPRKTT
jgi:hypothetical protein